MKSARLRTKPADTISVEEAGRRLGIGKNSAYRAVQRHEIPVLKFGRTLRVPLLAFERMLADPGHVQRPAGASS
jgi:excisionase family DNA binding protein